MTKADPKNKRKAGRVSVNLPAEASGPRGFFSHARCMQISPHGAELLLDWALETSQVYTVSIWLSPQLVLKDVRSTCVRCVKIGRHFRAGVSFLNLQGSTFEGLGALCQPGVLLP